MPAEMHLDVYRGRILRFGLDNIERSSSGRQDWAVSLKKGRYMLTPADLVCLDETIFEEQMKTIAEPVLSTARQSGWLAVQGGELYYELYSQKDAKGTVVICHGFTESERKYDEFVYYLLKAGFQAAVYDQRGHGRSFRESKSDYIVHINDFEDYVRDMKLMMDMVIKPFSEDKPLYLYGHSMGGCVSTLYLEQYPGDFRKAVLNAPMLAIQLGACPMFIAKAICDIKKIFGKGMNKLFFQGDFNPEEPFTHCNTTSEARHNYYLSIRRDNPCYQSSSASYIWGAQSIIAGRHAMQKRNIAKITIPVMVVMAGKDKQVQNKALQKFVNELPNGKLVSYPEASHEIYRSHNAILCEYLKEIIDFLI